MSGRRSADGRIPAERLVTELAKKERNYQIVGCTQAACEETSNPTVIIFLMAPEDEFIQDPEEFDQGSGQLFLPFT